MPAETVVRRWTVATWLVAGVRNEAETIARALEPLPADAIALQSIGHDEAATVAAALGMSLAWELSHYPRSRLLPGSALGLAVLSPHTIAASHGIVSNDHPSTWSTKRRIAQFAAVERSDHTGYAIAHTVGPSNVAQPPTGSMPLVVAVPEQVVANASRAIIVPDAATVVDSSTERPAPGADPFQVTTFEQPWVKGDFPTL
jgi:hypothetical protein